MKPLFIALAATCLVASAFPQAIAIRGSTILQPAAEKWAVEYAKLKPGAKVEVLGGGSATGFQALAAAQADLGAASRKIEPKESADISAKRGKSVVEYKVAIDGVAIFVNTANRVTSLTVAQLADILTGKITNWSTVGGNSLPIRIYGRDTNSGTYGFVKEHVLKNQAFAAGVVVEPSGSQVMAEVENDPGGLGYGSTEYAKGIRHLKIAAAAGSPAIAPDLGSIRSGAHPLTRGLFFYSAGPPNAAVRDFLRFVASDKGQVAAEAVGLYSLSAGDRARLAAELK